MDSVLRYFDYQVRSEEIPGEVSLLIFLASCSFLCENCHTPWLWEDEGEPLEFIMMDLLSAYRERITCVCFMGEGSGTTKEIAELKKWCSVIRNLGLKTGIYTGRDGYPQKWMDCFDYSKMGRYIQEVGPLTSKNTNQRLFINCSDGWNDITELFWS